MQSVEAIPTKHKLTPEQARNLRDNLKELEHVPLEWLEKLRSELILGNLAQQVLDNWGSVDLLVRDVYGRTSIGASMLNVMAYAIEPLPPNPDFFPVVETKHFRLSINQTTGDIQISNRGRDLPRQFYRSEKLRHDEKEKLLSLLLADHYAEREPEQLRTAHERRDRFPKVLKHTRKTLKRGRKLLKLIMAGKREAREREARK
jgi:hypothetical protein